MITVGVAAGPAPDALMRGSGQVRRLRHRLDPCTGLTTRIRVALPPPAQEVSL
jgi:hypothetical protein